MARTNRRLVLKEAQKKEVVAILSVGCPRSTAARYVGCTPNALMATAEEDRKFAEQLRHAEGRAEMEYMRTILEAARKEGKWQAATWFLERKNPQEYGQRSPQTITVEQARRLFAQLGAFASEVFPEGPARQKFVKEVSQLVQELLGPETPREKDDEPEPLDPQ